MKDRPVPQEIYRHFKGGLYQVITTAVHSETGEEMVVYQALYGDYKTYCRPLSMFMSEAGDGSGRRRFTYEGSAGAVRADRADVTPAPVDTEKAAMNAANPADTPEPAPAAASGQISTRGIMSKTIEEEAEELGMDPRVVAFLDADGASERLKILDSLRGMATNEMIDIMAMSAGFDIDEGEPWDRFAELRECLKTVERFETSRLR